MHAAKTQRSTLRQRCRATGDGGLKA
jgi:hypothetical protein